MEISLTPDLQKFVDEKVRAGQFESASAVVQRAVALLREEESLTAEDVAELRAELQLGLDQLDAGQGAEWNVEEHKTRLRDRAEKAKRAS
jgi:antitoxin ParD1/3/4